MYLNAFYRLRSWLQTRVRSQIRVVFILYILLYSRKYSLWSRHIFGGQLQHEEAPTCRHKKNNPHQWTCNIVIVSAITKTAVIPAKSSHILLIFHRWTTLRMKDSVVSWFGLWTWTTFPACAVRASTLCWGQSTTNSTDPPQPRPQAKPSHLPPNLPPHPPQRKLWRYW